MDDIERYMKEEERKREERRKAFFEKCASKVNDGELIYRLLGLGLCERFRLELQYNGQPPYVVWALVNHFVEEVDEPWDKWLTKNDAPMIRSLGHVKRIFPELAEIYDDEEEIIELANKLYGLEIETDGDCCDRAEYMFAYSFDFNSFEPLQVKEIRRLKTEKEVLAKYGYDTNRIDEQLSAFGLTDEEMEAI